MDLLITGLLFLGVVLTGLAAFGVGRPRLHLGWLGVAAALLAALISGLPS